MPLRQLVHTTLLRTLAASIAAAGIFTIAAAQEASRGPLAITAGKITINGTSNVHEYSASTTAVRVTRVQLAPGVAGATFWEDVLKPGAVQSFEIAVPAATLASDKEGLDKNMHKALKVDKHPEITFKLSRFEPGVPGTLKAIGTLTIAGVEREIAFGVKTQRKDASLIVKGEVPLLMTDYGIAPPKAMLGMLKTDPKVTIVFETVLTVPLT